ncbi:hypothetical protein [Flavobacterium sp. GCM10023249]|uniref:hypothetical protein n=1 Tax=unclassified Flavobacterium TaxID=196869 RepID=UPI00360A8FB8
MIYSVLNEFIPDYETINLDYTGKPDDEYYEFKSEDEMIGCYIDTPNVSQTLYWNKLNDNPDQIMVGANITEDNQIVFSLTLNGTPETEAKYYLRLKKFLNSNIGVITYIDPAEYENGMDFKQRYKNVLYEFESNF